MVSTAYNLTKILSRVKYDLAINFGIAGSFNRSLDIGEVVYVKSDMFSELGAEDDEKFLTLNEMGLSGQNSFSPEAIKQYPVLGNLKKVSGITVNTVHGNESSIKKITERLHPDIETMEGAAFYFVCENENVPAIQLRGISNYIEKRNRDNWNIPLAIKSVSEAVKQFMHEI